MASYENATTHSNNHFLVLRAALWEARKGERGHASTVQYLVSENIVFNLILQLRLLFKI